MVNYMTIGGITLDDTIIYKGRSMFDAPGGNSIYSALGAHIWADGVGVVGCIGPDYPQKYLGMLEHSGIDTKGIVRVKTPSQHLWLLYEEDGSRQFVFHKNSGTIDSEIDPTPSQIPVEYKNVKMAHLSAMGFQAQYNLAKTLTENNINYSYDITQAGLDIEGTQYSNNFATRNSKLLVPSIEEVELIYGKQPIFPLLKQISELGPGYIAIKMAAKGSVVFNAEENRAFQIPIFPVDVIDSTGAGDAYCGGFMVGFCETGNIIEAGIYGTVSASYAIADFGAFHMLNIDRTEAVKRANFLREKVVAFSE